jgi:hypothetical protein
MSNLNYNWISYSKNCSKNHLENHVGKSQRTNTKMVAARENRETVNTLFVCHRADSSRRRLRRRSDANGCNGDNKQQTALAEKSVGIVDGSQIRVFADDAIGD